MEMKTKILKVLNLNDLVLIDNRIYKIVLKPCSNGTKKWYIPILKLHKENPYKSYNKNFNLNIKNTIIENLNKVELDKKDFPIDEESIIKKDIFKD